MRYQTFLATGAALMLFTLAGCGTRPPSPEQASTAAVARDTDDLRYSNSPINEGNWAAATPYAFDDPVWANQFTGTWSRPSADLWYMQQYYANLLRFTPESTVEPDMATDWTVSDDGLTYTFNLRPDARFADGSPITGDDWKWSLDRCRNPENGIWSFTMEAVDTIDTSDTQVVFHLKYPYVPFIYSAALFNCVVMPAKLVEAAGGWENFMLQPIGSGPFIMKEWVKGDHMLLVRNPYYW